MTDEQISAAADIIAQMVASTSLMAATPKDSEVPGSIVKETGRVFTESLADLAELIGGRDLRNNTLLDAVNMVSQMDRALQEAGIL